MSHPSGVGEAARRQGGVRTAFGSFGRGNARLATVGNAIEGRHVTAHFTENTNGTKASSEASEAIRVARPQTKRRTAQRISREGAFGAHLFSDGSTTTIRLRKEGPGPWRASRRRGVGAARA